MAATAAARSSVRAALDIGSGGMKIAVAEVATQRGGPRRGRVSVTKVLFEEEHPVKLSLDLASSPTNELSAAIRAEGVSTLSALVAEARRLGCVGAVPGVATAVFRRAANGEAYLDELAKATGATLSVIAQSEEARLGFGTAVAAVEAADGAAPERMVVWDSGGGSFQVVGDSTDDGGGGAAADTYLGEFGSAEATRLCVEDVQGRDFAANPSPNPVTAADAAALVGVLRSKLPAPLPAWVAEAPVVHAIGSINSIFYLASEVLGASRFSAADVAGALARVSGQTDDALAAAWCTHPRSDPPTLVVPKLCLLLAVMEGLKMRSVRYMPSVGCCAGIIRSPEYYETS